MLDSIKFVKDKVTYTLERSKRARDDDVFLYILILEKFYGLSDKIGFENSKKLLKLMADAPCPESIRRARQRVQEEGHFIGNRKLKRELLENEVRENIKNV